MRNESLTPVCLSKDHVLGQLQVATIVSREHKKEVMVKSVRESRDEEEPAICQDSGCVEAIWEAL